MMDHSRHLSRHANEGPSRSLFGRLGIRIAAVSLLAVGAVSAVGYRATFERFQAQEIERLRIHVAERARTESRLFETAEMEVQAFADLFLRYYLEAPSDLAGEFDRYFRRGTDGAWRTRPALHEGLMTEEGERFQWVSGFLGASHGAVAPDLRRRLVIALRLLARLGPATDPGLLLHASFPENALAMYSKAPWGLQARADLDVTEGSVVRSTLQSENPERRPVWTDLYFDLTAGHWSVTYQLPVDHDGHHLVNPSHDVQLTELLDRTIHRGPPGTRTMILTADGALVAHPDRLDAVQREKGQLDLAKLGDAELLRIYERIRAHGPIREGEVSILEDPESAAHLAVTGFHGPDWWWVTVYPESLVAHSAHRAARLILLLGLLLFLFLMTVVYWFVRRMVAAPVEILTEAAARIADGDLAIVADGQLPLPERRGDEIGLLARAFRRMAGSLREARELDDAIFLLDREGRLHGANPALGRMTGYSVDELLHRSLFDLGAASDSGGFRELLRDVEPGDSRRFTTRFRRREGDDFPVEVSARAFDTPEGVRFAATARDIAERIEQERRRLDLQREELERQRAESLGILAGGVAHDFNNILAAILGNAELARAEVPSGSPVGEMLDEISRAGERAALLARQMLAYSGRGAFQTREVNLSRVVAEAIERLRPVLPESIRLDLALAPDLPPILADAVQIRQAVSDLVLNAREALGADSGTIRVATYAREVSARELAGSPDRTSVDPGRYVILEIADTGPGIDEETASRIFEPFFTTKFTGRGLGLPAVLGIVRGHGGELLADGNPGRGALFRILFPPAGTPSESGR